MKEEKIALRLSEELRGLLEDEKSKKCSLVKEQYKKDHSSSHLRIKSCLWALVRSLFFKH